MTSQSWVGSTLSIAQQATQSFFSACVFFLNTKIPLFCAFLKHKGAFLQSLDKFWKFHLVENKILSSQFFSSHYFVKFTAVYFAMPYLIKRQSYYHIETSQANQIDWFLYMATLAFNEFITKRDFKCLHWFITFVRAEMMQHVKTKSVRRKRLSW